MQVRVLPREISRGARTAATMSGRSEAAEATINERVALEQTARRMRRAVRDAGWFVFTVALVAGVAGGALVAFVAFRLL